MAEYRLVGRMPTVEESNLLRINFTMHAKQAITWKNM